MAILEIHEINQAYSHLKDCKENLASHTENVTTRSLELEKVKAIALSNGTVQGKNETERKAALLLLFEKQTHELEEAERVYRDARLYVEIAELEVKRVETLVRWLK